MAVAIRRGPSRHTAVVGWDRATDRFKVGQWLYGRIYERRCDLSPDGKHLVYFAMNGRWDSRARGAWTAISKAPYLKALTLLAKGDCRHGGGLFASSKELWSTTATDTESSRTTHASCAQRRIRGTSNTVASAPGSTTCACSAMAGR